MNKISPEFSGALHIFKDTFSKISEEISVETNKAHDELENLLISNNQANQAIYKKGLKKNADESPDIEAIFKKLTPENNGKLPDSFAKNAYTELSKTTPDKAVSFLLEELDVLFMEYNELKNPDKIIKENN